MAITEHVSVEPVALTSSARHISTLHADTHEVLTSAHRNIDSAISAGWIGSSADAMRARLETMRTAADVVTNRLDDHAKKLHASAATYATTDNHAAEAIATASHPGAHSRSLNLDC